MDLAAWLPKRWKPGVAMGFHTTTLTWENPGSKPFTYNPGLNFNDLLLHHVYGDLP